MSDVLLPQPEAVATELKVATPINDGQTMAILAAIIGGDPVEAVDKAARLLVLAEVKRKALPAMLRRAHEDSTLSR